jgi:hypothetical protein
MKAEKQKARELVAQMQNTGQNGPKLSLKTANREKYYPNRRTKTI